MNTAGELDFKPLVKPSSSALSATTERRKPQEHWEEEVGKAWNRT